MFLTSWMTLICSNQACAYKRVNHVPIYLEWAPAKIMDAPLLTELKPAADREPLLEVYHMPSGKYNLSDTFNAVFPTRDIFGDDILCTCTNKCTHSHAVTGR